MIGFLKDRIEIQSRTTEVNVRGGFSYGFSSVGERWAAISPVSQTDVNRYREYQVETDTRILLRYDPDESMRPKAGDRLIYGDNVIEVTAVIDTLYNKDYLELLGVTVYEH